MEVSERGDCTAERKTGLKTVPSSLTNERCRRGHKKVLPADAEAAVE